LIFFGVLGFVELGFILSMRLSHSFLLKDHLRISQLHGHINHKFSTRRTSSSCAPQITARHYQEILLNEAGKLQISTLINKNSPRLFNTGDLTQIQQHSKIVIKLGNFNLRLLIGRTSKYWRPRRIHSLFVIIASVNSRFNPLFSLLRRFHLLCSPRLQHF
jgi:hypothetical protein